MKRKLTALIVLIVLCVAAAQSRADQEIYAITGGGDLTWAPPGGAGFVDADSNPVSDSATLDDSRFLFASASISARASRGAVGGSIAGSFVTAPGGGTLPFHPTVTAQSVGTITFHGSTPTIETSLNMNIGGAMSLDTLPGSSFRYAFGHVDFQMRVGGTMTEFLSILDANESSPTTFNQFNNMVLVEQGNGFVVNALGTTGPITVPVEVPFTAGLFLKLFYNIGAGAPAGAAGFSANFSHTFSFATSGPVFNLPEGYTVDGFGIVDNHFAVPEPSAAILLFASIGVLLCRGQCRRQRRLTHSLAV
jgi:hypothetical protein